MKYIIIGNAQDSLARIIANAEKELIKQLPISKDDQQNQQALDLHEILVRGGLRCKIPNMNRRNQSKHHRKP